MKIYNYDKETKVFLSEADARENPLEEGKFLIPAFATDKTPLDEKIDNRIIFDVVNNKWIYEAITTYYKYDDENIFIEQVKSYEVVESATTSKVLSAKDGKIALLVNDVWEYSEDNRDKNYWLKDDASKIEFALGDVVDNTMTDIEPLNDFPLWEVNIDDDKLSKWIDEPIATEKKRESDITFKADDVIYTKYPQIKQNKLQSQGLKLTLKIAKGGTLTADEILLEESILAIDAEITAIREIENTAITDGTLLADIDWTV